eukprot:1499587-Amphidinium_carterae.2
MTRKHHGKDSNTSCVSTNHRPSWEIIPDFIKRGVVTCGLTDASLRDHLVLHKTRLKTLPRSRQK